MAPDDIPSSIFGCICSQEEIDLFWANGYAGDVFFCFDGLWFQPMVAAAPVIYTAISSGTCASGIVHLNLWIGVLYNCPLQGYFILDAPVRSQSITFPDRFSLQDHPPIVKWPLSTFHYHILEGSKVRKSLTYFWDPRCAGDFFFFWLWLSSVPANIYRNFFNVCIGNCALVPHKIHHLLLIDSREWVDYIANSRLSVKESAYYLFNHKNFRPNGELVSVNSHQAPPKQLQNTLTEEGPLHEQCECLY